MQTHSPNGESCPMMTTESSSVTKNSSLPRPLGTLWAMNAMTMVDFVGYETTDEVGDEVDVGERLAVVVSRVSRSSVANYHRHHWLARRRSSQPTSRHWPTTMSHQDVLRPMHYMLNCCVTIEHFVDSVQFRRLFDPTMIHLVSYDVRSASLEQLPHYSITIIGHDIVSVSQTQLYSINNNSTTR